MIEATVERGHIGYETVIFHVFGGTQRPAGCKFLLIHLDPSVQFHEPSSFSQASQHKNPWMIHPLGLEDHGSDGKAPPSSNRAGFELGFHVPET
jgi:hypothetical protein